MNDWDAAIQAIKDARSILLIAHRNPDGDAIGSQLGLFHALRDAGWNVHMHNVDGIPRVYRFLPGSEHIREGELPPMNPSPDLVVSVDCGELYRLGIPRERLNGGRILNIDHHATNSRFGDINLVVPEAAATGAIVLELIDRLGLPLSRAAASAIYVALMTDTGSFRHANTTDKEHLMAARLIKAGANPWEIAKGVYESSTLERIRLLAACLGTLELHDHGRSAWLYVDDKMYQNTGTDVEDTEGFIEYGRALIGVEIAVFLRPEEGGWKVSFRSKGDLDVGRLAGTLGGGGHRHAAGCTLPGDLNEVRAKVQKEVSKLLES